MREDRHRCPTCKGTGTIRLNGVYHETLALARTWCKRRGFIVANHAAEAAGCSPPALSNRLVRLEEMGYLTSKRYGRQRRYKLP